jgi:hypothetical protein
MEPPPPPIFDEHLEPGIRLKRRQSRLDEYLTEVNQLEKKILSETGQRVNTRQRWTSHYNFKSKKEDLELKIADLQKSHDLALAEQAGLATTTSSEEDMRPRLQKILDKEGPVPANIMHECYALILREHKSLDFIRHMSPVTVKTFFNFELQPLKDEVARLMNENHELRNPPDDTNRQVEKKEHPLQGLVKYYMELLDKEREKNKELHERLLDAEFVAETQPNPALEASLARLKEQVANLKADLTARENLLQIQDDRIKEVKIDANRYKAQAQARTKAVEQMTHAKDTIKELEDKLRIKEYDLNNSLLLNDFLKDQYDQLNRKTDVRLATLADIHIVRVQEKDAEIQQKNTEIQQKDAEIQQKNTELQEDKALLKERDQTNERLKDEKKIHQAEYQKVNNRLNQELKTATEDYNTLQQRMEKQISVTGKLSKDKQRMEAFKTSFEDFLIQALPLANGDDKVFSSFIQIWHTWTKEHWHTETATGTQYSAAWAIKSPATPTSVTLDFESSSTISLAAKLFFLVHTRKQEEPMALGILPELIRRMPHCNDSWAARIVVECIAKFNDDRSKIVKTMETASVSLSLLQLYGEAKKRFPSIMKVPGMTQKDRVIVSGLRAYTRQCDDTMGTISDKLCFAENTNAGVSVLRSVFGRRMVQYPLQGLCLISDTTTEWVVVISEEERSITLTSKLLFQLDDNNTTLTHWAYSVKKPSELSDITLIDHIEAVECQWWQKYILNFLPFDDNLNALLEGMRLT